MSNPDSEKYNLLDQLAEEFADRYRRGERPALKEYTDRYPKLANEIRELFPALVKVEDVDEALRQAEAACRQVPDRSSFVSTLGLAQYRAGNYQVVGATLEHADELNSVRVRSQKAVTQKGV
jgi:uncharacterized protein HemY